MSKRGKFITIEGVEGSGKTTQATLLSDYLRKEGIDVVETREPGGTEIGERIREVLLSPAHAGLVSPAELFLFLAARAQQVSEIILPALGAGKWVVCDRFCDATMAYQGYGRGLDINIIRSVNELATGGLVPDITILLDLDVEIGIRRAVSAKREFANHASGDRMEKEGPEFHRSVRKGYFELASREPDRIRVIPVSGSVEEVHRTVVSLIKPFLVKRA
ncbi:MAG: dTMP kinase [Candidatus Abyssobacteria bacterium SURF_17]|jgi:dTMP kinase|uniref:Thymidylate kinase n=1 Tax=Candidatus Abyssobacteria bacterium SURF_17 TaxID=2093361 RepID=A0A419F863_9BACT|nr:MAG: dTMP kinase [Candidatus Abyssubacteria bacterium SURF_17]